MLLMSTKVERGEGDLKTSLRSFLEMSKRWKQVIQVWDCEDVGRKSTWCSESKGGHGSVESVGTSSGYP